MEMVSTDPWLDAQWEDALLAAQLFAVNPRQCSVLVKSPAGVIRERWLSYCKNLLPSDTVFRTLPTAITDDRLLGGLDLAATLRAGTPVERTGILKDVDGGVLLATMAERMTLDTASRLATTLDFGEVRVEREGVSTRHETRFGVIAFDEGEGEEAAPSALKDRLAIALDLTAFSIHQAYEPLQIIDVKAARGQLSKVDISDDIIATFCVMAAKLGISSLRAVMLAVDVAKTHAALSGHRVIDDADVAAAARLVLAHRATMIPAEDEAFEKDIEDQSPPPPDSQNHDNDNDPKNITDIPLDDVVLEAVKAGLPAGLLAQLKEAGKKERGKAEVGRFGQTKLADQRGRPIGSRRGELRSGKRLDVIGTLRSAAPWQRFRRRQRGEKVGPRVEVRPDDFQIMRYKDRTETATIFAVDASGSTALSRLAEAKGAVELLLSESYARRDHVALVSFRNKEAELLLSPTRSLVRAKRALAALPGGGGTPLASGIEAAMLVAEEASRKGRTPTFVLLTDGSANISLDGTPGRQAAFDDALAMARRFGVMHSKALVVDISRRRSKRAEELAQAINGTYVPLPNVDAQALSSAVKALQ